MTALLLCCLFCRAQALPPGPTWTQLTNLPARMTASDATTVISVGADGYLYSAVRTGQPFVVTVFRTRADDPVSWQDITGKGLPSTTPVTMAHMPDGTVLMSTTTGKGNADVFAWNGSTEKPSWSRIKGWGGESSSKIHDFTNDSAGYTYFSPAWSGVVWRNDRPNSLHFNQISDNLYSITGGGATGHPNDGGIFQLKVWDLGDGKGDMIWACGEGELDNISLKFKKSSNTAYLADAAGYRGNCTSLARSATSILAIRVADNAGDGLTSIDIATRVATIHAGPSPRTATSFPPYISTYQMGALHWMSGTTFVLSVVDMKQAPVYLLLSRDDGKTWTDIAVSPELQASCPNNKLYAGAVVTSKYIFARCEHGRAMWRFGPVE